MIKYPTKKGDYARPSVGVKNRGMALEKLIDESNAHYLREGHAVIHKKPTPVQIVRVDYPAREKAKIVEAYYKIPSTTDYNGVYRGVYIDFDVKETRNKTAFPINNVHAHQIDHLKAVDAQGGVAFLLIRFVHHGTVHLLPYQALKTFVARAETGRKSIAYDELKQEGIAIDVGYRPAVDYLRAVDALLKGRP